jgi:polysaccharide export outer membrane protein
VLNFHTLKIPLVSSVSLLFPKAFFVVAVAVMALTASTWAQNQPGTGDRIGRSTQSAEGSLASASPTDQFRKLSIGPGDELEVSVYGVPELSQHVRVDTSGDVHLLLVGASHVAGLSAGEAQDVIEKQLVAGKFVKNPEVSVFVKDFTNEAVSVVGEVNRPGSYPALSTRRLYDAFQQAGGLTPAAGKVSITHQGQTTPPTVVTLSNDPVKSAQANVEIMPGDAISVARAPIVYVIGEVNKPGGYVLDEALNSGTSSRLTVMRVIALASGPGQNASLKKSRIIRRTASGLQELPISLKDIMAGKAPDPPLQAEDIVYVPGRKSYPYLNMVLATVTTASIYRF